MYVRWTTYRCPSCTARTESRLVTSPRVGIEYRKCRSCGSTYRTPDREWQHMTTGQRVGYFLNEWAVAIIGLSILFAILIYYADKSDLQISAGLVAVSIACCVPFWLWKYSLVRRSITRTTTLNARQSFETSKDWIISLRHPQVHQPTQYTPPATYEAPKKSSGIGVGWKIRLSIFGIAIIIGILDNQWKTIDKYFPALNKAIHSGTPTSEGDMDYLVGHLQQDEQTLSEGCTEKMKFQECRTHILANKPALDDLRQRVQALNDAWVKENSERSVPAECQTKMNRLVAALNQYVKVEGNFSILLQSMDSPEATRKLQPTLDEISGQEDAAVNALHEVKMGSACDGY